MFELLIVIEIVRSYLLGHPCTLQTRCSAAPPSHAAPPNWAGVAT